MNRNHWKLQRTHRHQFEHCMLNCKWVQFRLVSFSLFLSTALSEALQFQVLTNDVRPMHHYLRNTDLSSNLAHSMMRSRSSFLTHGQLFNNPHIFSSPSSTLSFASCQSSPMRQFFREVSDHALFGNSANIFFDPWPFSWSTLIKTRSSLLITMLFW